MQKIVFITLLVFGFASKMNAQTNVKDSLKYFVVLYTTGEAWDTTKQFYEQKYFEDHSKFLSKLRKEKVVIAGGRYSDTGMIILKAPDEKAAYKYMESDISVKNKLFKFELSAFDVFYSGCLEATDE